MSWADQFNTYEEACIYYGADTPASIKLEMDAWTEESYIQEQDDMEARGGPAFYVGLLDDFPF